MASIPGEGPWRSVADLPIVDLPDAGVQGLPGAFHWVGGMRMAICFTSVFSTAWC